MDLASRSFSESVPYPSSESYRSGLVVGLTAEQDLGDIVSLTAEPVYVQKGSTTSIFLNGQNQAATSKANYLEIPVVIKLRLLSGLISPYITAGPYVSFLLSADGQTEIGDRIEIYDQKEFTRPIEIGVQGGIGGEYDLSTSLSFLVEVRYSRGLSKVLKEPFSQTLRSYGFLFTASILYTL
jgi:opacity protein-like surface antigen